MSSIFSAPVHVKSNVSWAPIPNKVSIHTGSPDTVVTASLVIVSSPDGILLTRVRSRGWDLPGGHVEDGETPQEAAYRETVEEAGVVLKSLHEVGFLRLTVTAPKPENYRYPYPLASQQIFSAWLGDGGVLSPDLALECDEAKWFSIKEVLELCKDRTWLPLLSHI